MGLIKDFREFLKLKHGKTYNTNELYVAEIGTISIAETSDHEYLNAHFEHDRHVIVQKATGEEVRKHLIKKYGEAYGHPDIYFNKSKFENPDRTTYYKLITMNNRLLPTATPRTILGNAEVGCYEVIRQAKTMNGLKNHAIRFAEILDLDSIKEIEEIINNQPDFTM